MLNLSRPSRVAALALGVAALGSTAAVAQKRAENRARVVTVTNARDVVLERLSFLAADGTTVLAQLAGPLAPGKSARLTVKAGAPCEVAVQGVYADESEVDVPSFDVCAQRTARLTE